MVRISNPEDYEIKDIMVAQDGKHKYVAILRHKRTDTDRKVPFGDRRYSHYRDSLGFYSNLDHMDKERQEAFLNRHARNIGHKFSSGWFSKTFLWT